MLPIDMERVNNIHLIGVGGCGVSAIAKILHQLGFQVTGSDLKENSNTIRLKDLGVKVYIGHDSAHVREADLVVYSSAVHENNVEYKEVLSKKIPMVKRAEMLSWIINRFEKKITVAGTHGKTTTTSMLAKIFLEAGLDPTFLIGGETDSVNGNACLGAGMYAIAEADESDGSFLALSPSISVITNIEPDHMEYFGSVENLLAVFENYIKRTDKDGVMILGIDNPTIRQLLPKITGRKITYGFSNDADFRAINQRFDGLNTTFEVYCKGKTLGEMVLTIPGEQNISNCLAAIAVATEAAIPFNTMANILHSFKGAKRRFQILGDIGGIMVIDDYAHHPTEIKATLKGARLAFEGSNKRIVALFQPHRYSRTSHLALQFGGAFEDADLVFLTDIYSAGETPIPGIDGKTIANEVQKYKKTLYFPRKENIAEQILKVIRPNDVLLVMGAGDINNVGREIVSRLKIKYEA